MLLSLSILAVVCPITVSSLQLLEESIHLPYSLCLRFTGAVHASYYYGFMACSTTLLKHCYFANRVVIKRFFAAFNWRRRFLISSWHWDTCY